MVWFIGKLNEKHLTKQNDTRVRRREILIRMLELRNRWQSSVPTFSIQQDRLIEFETKKEAIECKGYILIYVKRYLIMYRKSVSVYFSN